MALTNFGERRICYIRKKNENQNDFFKQTREKIWIY